MNIRSCDNGHNKCWEPKLRYTIAKKSYANWICRTCGTQGSTEVNEGFHISEVKEDANEYYRLTTSDTGKPLSTEQLISQGNAVKSKVTFTEFGVASTLNEYLIIKMTDRLILLTAKFERVKGLLESAKKKFKQTDDYGVMEDVDEALTELDKS